eukprot:gene8638-10632_t
MAPMVRVSTLPMRLLAKRYGCHIAYSEELIDLKVMKSTRVVNETLNTIDYLAKDKSLVYRTNREDTFNVIQLGSASAITALAAAQVVVRDVSAIDINMGCPKSFSVQGGMGSALLSKPETIKDILTTLIRNLPIPVTCKIRLLSSDRETIDLLKIIESTGVSAIAIHGREIPERPRDPAHWDRLANILSLTSFGVPIIANGDIFTRDDIGKVKEQTKANSVMIARGAIRNVSLFSDQIYDPPVTYKTTIREYLKIAMEYDNQLNNTKFVITNILNENNDTVSNEAKEMRSSKDLYSICKIWGLGNEYEQYQKSKKLENQNNITNGSKKKKKNTTNNNQSKKVEKEQEIKEKLNIDICTDNNNNNNLEQPLKKQKIDDQVVVNSTPVSTTS